MPQNGVVNEGDITPMAGHWPGVEPYSSSKSGRRLISVN
jgi:hypothetical protein